ncbi:hypothetical protein [Rhizobium sp. Leaf262]|uniref:hypothetical protein n=1 Tax=Rhizobium sp. Leaf262 TaxID=1736312 RepID=UPI000715A79C|nr:hypothetical protein [Rhizobium sp. Leaf262]KQO79462.1 hypothetical protein ASF29_23415 [Rhizobium sp. Leaf262]
MLPKTGSSASFVRSGIIELNTIRNKFAHRLDHEIKPKDLTAMIDVLRYARSAEAFEGPLDVIEGFMPVAAAWLAVPPKHLQTVFDDAFAKIRLQTPKIIEEMKEKMRSR